MGLPGEGGFIRWVNILTKNLLVFLFIRDNIRSGLRYATPQRACAANIIEIIQETARWRRKPI
ncbi:MAG: hypothetical protein A2167_04575 [Planctomycetes bacterium RBG_13_46_10]|nr:MAG: hypothetical protein A2167_04575 [Planctomycetes bacterium RBG_13_46_10]